MTIIHCPRQECDANWDGKCTETVITLSRVNFLLPADPDDRHAPNDWLLCDNYDKGQNRGAR